MLVSIMIRSLKITCQIGVENAPSHRAWERTGKQLVRAMTESIAQLEVKLAEQRQKLDAIMKLLVQTPANEQLVMVKKQLKEVYYCFNNPHVYSSSKLLSKI